MRRTLPGIEGEYPHGGPAWGGGADVTMREPRPVGADSRAVLRDAGLTEAEVDALFAAGVSGEVAPPAGVRVDPPGAAQLGIERGELSRVDEQFDGWKTAREEVRR